MSDALEAYGRLTEGLHFAGYSFERACANLESLLEGDAWQLDGRFGNVNDFLDSLRLDKFRAVAEQRKRIAQRIKELQPAVSNRQIARTLSVDESTIRDDLAGNSAHRKKSAKENNERETGSAGNPARALSGAQAAKIVQRRETGRLEHAARIARIAEISKGNADLPTGVRFPVIYADPPWRYENPPMGGGNRSIENHYPTMTLEEICALPVGDLAADDAMLYLWATSPKLAECMKVIEAWGFMYRTSLVWVKDKIGMGYHARNQHEFLLVARRGDMPPPPLEVRVSSVVEAPRGEHSAKPGICYELIERFYPTLPRIELFSRAPRDGWAAWGNQAGGSA
jgi:N6-adenosine-specific RNA methylase IME4